MQVQIGRIQIAKVRQLDGLENLKATAAILGDELSALRSALGRTLTAIDGLI